MVVGLAFEVLLGAGVVEGEAVGVVGLLLLLEALELGWGRCEGQRKRRRVVVVAIGSVGRRKGCRISRA